MSFEEQPPTQSRTPRAFVSYAWTDQRHQRWVVDLAEALRRDGVDVILDVWDLSPGQEKYQFMEQMVADTSIDKVLIICNPTYATKADARDGGVGDETQIISPQVYAKTDNKRFIPIIAEMNDDATPAIPTYLKTRIYIDLSSEQVYYEGYERLLRLLHGAPAFEKPKLGQKPMYLEPATGNVATSPLLRRAVHALEAEKRSAPAEARACLGELADAIARLRVRFSGETPRDEQVLDAIRRSKAPRDEFVVLLSKLCELAPTAAIENLLLPFLGRTLDACEHAGEGPWAEDEFDGARFATMEILLHTLALLVAHDRFDVLRTTLAEAYVHNYRGNRRKSNYSAFYFPVETIEVDRKHRLISPRVSLVADLMKERADQPGASFQDLQLIELLLYVRSQLVPDAWWFPRTLVFLHPQPFDPFIAPESRRNSQLLSAFLNLQTPGELAEKLEVAFATGGRAGRLDFGSGRPTLVRPLLGLDDP